ncbi:unnamed protein product [Vicia faba]|uniref:Protein kinase domain-containing protein n=1 Tax=Vicia faba TaxID=3906 RepID=A0AAV1AY82_VICFA|nr:unnamed protein product [Vicia faba]
MKPLLHHSSSIFVFFNFFTLLMIFLINIPTCLCEDDEYTNCNTAFSCEDNIKDLKSQSITLKYRILGWDDKTRILTVARDDYSDGDVCAGNNNDQNSTFDNSTKFQRYNDVANVTLLYGCNVGAINVLPPFYDIDCGKSKYIVYTVVYSDSFSAFCAPTHTVVIPILESLAQQLGSGNGLLSNVLKKSLQSGFDLKWSGSYGECESCVTSGGACGNEGNTQFKCFCSDGINATSCLSPEFSPSSSKHGWRLSWRLIVILIGAAGFGVTMFFIIIIIRCHLKRGTGRQQKSIFRERRNLVEHNVDVFMQNYNSSMPRRYSYIEVKMITNSFREKLGQGGYGAVYKASLIDGRLVAVKVINESKGNGEEFINEVASISRTSHMNIVSLFGYCYEGNKRALIYEFMPKGSLDRFIYKSEFPNAICDFDWNTLFQIAIGIARGLEYLHHGCNSRILHLDIKPQNILLDEDFCPKISDFGLARICQKKDSTVSILGARGTIGYMAPEIFSRAFGGVSYKSDVYSYGMLILEMIGGRKNYDTVGSCTSEMYFPDWIYKDLEQGNTSNTLLNSLTISEEENDMVRKITFVSLWCIQTNPSNRPPMNKVIEMLQGPLSSVSYPPKPVLFSPELPPLQVESISSSDLYETNSIRVSK